MGIPYEEVVGTGTIATLKGKKDHPVIGLRCDIDALSIKEGCRQHPVIGLRCDIDALSIKEAKELPYRSENDGVMHACGHDGHISMLLTAAKVLSDHRDELNCTVKLIFQPAEEKTNGALKMLETGRVGHLDTVVVSICTFHSGTMANIFAETAELSGTVRTFNPELRKHWSMELHFMYSIY